MPTGILSLKLARPRGMTRRRLVGLLEQARRDCCRARNAAAMRWYVWRRDHPDWEPGDPYDAPETKINRKPKLDAKPPKDSRLGPRLFLSRDLYGAAREAAPRLSASLASTCVQEVVAKLKAAVPYDHDGEARYYWEAVLAHEVSLPTWRGGRIPCLRRCSTLVYDDHQCLLRFQLLSKQSGWRYLSPAVNLAVGDMTVGNRRLLKELASGERRIADSAIVEAKGQWFLRLCYEVPAAATGLPPDRVMTLAPSPEDDRWPFALSWTQDGSVRTWKIGKAKPLVAEYRRIVARRRAIRYRYSDGCGKGHGRQRWYKSLRPIARSVRDAGERFAKQTVADVVAFSIRQGCGKLHYREPTKPVRTVEFFASAGVPFDWTAFEARLRFRAETAGLEYETSRIRMAEWRGERDAG